MSLPASGATVVEVSYPKARGSIGLRGSHAPLSWEETTHPIESHEDLHVFRIDVPEGELLELKLVRNEEDWAGGRNYVVHAGDHLFIDPWFDARSSTLLDPALLEAADSSLVYRVLLPPSYGEQPNKRYPVLYAQDGQSLWSTSEDPFGVWSLDSTLDQLYELGATSEIIVVAIETAADRIERLSHVPDPHHGGGRGVTHLQLLAEHLVPLIDSSFRTKADRANRALMGSSMGGLFSFIAAWSRSDLFGKAACLSSSFWWANRHAVRLVCDGAMPEQRPFLYLDSGAAHNPLEQDANVRDGFHHTRSMVRALVGRGFTPGVDLHWLTFAGEGHNVPAWASRVQIPLQLLFPHPVR